MTLRLVGAPEPPRPKRRKYQRAGSALSEEQQAKVRAALRNLRVAYGGWAPLAEVMDLTVNRLLRLVGRHGYAITGDTLIKACKAGGLSVDAMLGQPLSTTGRCTACGARRVA